MSEQKVTVGGIPNTLYICAGCGDLASGDCEQCAHMEYLAARCRRPEGWIYCLRGWLRCGAILLADFALFSLAAAVLVWAIRKLIAIL